MCTVYALHGIVAHDHDWMWTSLQHLKCSGTKEQLQHVCTVPTLCCMPCRVASEAVNHLTPHADSATIPAVTSASSPQQHTGAAAETPQTLPMEGAHSKPAVTSAFPQQQSKGVAADTPLTLAVEGAQSKPVTQPASTSHEHELPVAAKTEDQPRNYDINVPRSVPFTS